MSEEKEELCSKLDEVVESPEGWQVVIGAQFNVHIVERNRNLRTTSYAEDRRLQGDGVSETVARQHWMLEEEMSEGRVKV